MIRGVNPATQPPIASVFQTVVEAYTVGVIVSFYSVSVVVQAFFLTAAVVVGLTAFTMQSKRDFSNWGTGSGKKNIASEDKSTTLNLLQPIYLAFSPAFGS